MIAFMLLLSVGNAKKICSRSGICDAKSLTQCLSLAEERNHYECVQELKEICRSQSYHTTSNNTTNSNKDSASEGGLWDQIFSKALLTNTNQPSNGYSGEVNFDGEPNGQGKYVWENGDMHEGGWKDGEKHGQGTSIWADGDKYEGGWKEGKKHGQGTYYYSDGKKKYEGEWKEGKPHGQGAFFNSMFKWNYEGGWKEGKKHGQGEIVYRNGEKYEGEWSDDKENGQGTYLWSDGRKYVGQFKDGNLHGQGTYFESKRMVRGNTQ